MASTRVKSGIMYIILIILLGVIFRKPPAGCTLLLKTSGYQYFDLKTALVVHHNI